jgi:hypothetical protein
MAVTKWAGKGEWDLTPRPIVFAPTDHDPYRYGAEKAAADALAILRWAMNIGIGFTLGVVFTILVFWYRG